MANGKWEVGSGTGGSISFARVGLRSSACLVDAVDLRDRRCWERRVVELLEGDAAERTLAVAPKPAGSRSAGGAGSELAGWAHGDLGDLGLVDSPTSEPGCALRIP